MSELELRAALLAFASRLRDRSDNLLGDGCSAYDSMPTLRQWQYGMGSEAQATADDLVKMLDIDPRSLWPELLRPPPLPEEERSQLTWGYEA